MPSAGGTAETGALLQPSALEAFSAAELALAAAAGALLLAGGAYVGCVASASRAAPVLTPFTSLWAPRVALQLAAAACLGAMALRLPSWWSSGAGAWLASTPPHTQRLLCRLSVAVAYGAALPLLTALAVCISAAPRVPQLPPPATAPGDSAGAAAAPRRTRVGARVVLRALAAAAPVAALQSLIAFHDPIFGADGGVRRAFGPRFVDAFVQGDAALCPGGGGAAPHDAPHPDAGCALCTQPLLVSAVSGACARRGSARVPARTALTAPSPPAPAPPSPRGRPGGARVWRCAAGAQPRAGARRAQPPPGGARARAGRRTAACAPGQRRAARRVHPLPAAHARV
jgi:hypothetical protein